MKNNLAVIVFVFFSSIIFGQTVSSDSLSLYKGKKITVCDVVVDSHRNKGNQLTTFLNFGKPFPYQNFTVVIFNEDLKKFDDDPSKIFLGKKICITGKVRIYKGKPEIVVKQARQIAVVD
jgi:DNA/RNA endonuclease YhcR with UshA esterase domain